MYTNDEGRCRLLKSVAIVIGLLLIAGSFRVLAQQANGPANQEGLTMTDLLKLPGKLLGKGQNTRPVGQFNLQSYRIEEMDLPRSMKAEVRGQEVEVVTAWRLTLTGGPFPVRALPAVVWIDDQIVGYGVENEQLNSITAILFDQSLLHEGGTISLSYGEEKQGRVKLPEKLSLSLPDKGGSR